jgi:hypothetical protein
VVHRHRLARPENTEVDAELFEIGLALEPLELGEHASTLAVDPRRVAGVQDEPAFPLGEEPVLGLLERRLGNRH